jgi:CelD/BcsL family acetyltransferase involved in cellulose biosynthesis
MHLPAENSSNVSDSFEFDLVRTLPGLTALEPEWSALYEQAEQKNPFLSYSWTYACLQNQAPVPELSVLAMRRSGKLVGLAPLCIEKRFGLRILRFIAEDRSDYLGFLLSSANDGIEELVMAQLADRRLNWDLALLHRLAEPFTTIHKLSPPTGRWHRTEWTASAYHRFEGDFEALHEAGPSWIREMRKRQRRFVRDGGSALRLAGAEAAGKLTLVGEIEAASWKGAKDCMRLQPGAGQNIFREAFLNLGDQVELWLALFRGRPVAYRIDFLCGDRLWLYQGAFDAAYDKVRAGSVLSYVATERAWLHGVREYDYLTGDEAYKLNRTSALRPIFSLAGHRRTARGWLAYGLLVAPRWKLRRVAALRSFRNSLRGRWNFIRKGGGTR